MKRLLLVFLTIAVVAVTVHAQGTPFKLGTFERQGRPFVGIVLRDSVVIDFAAANTAMAPARVTSPTDMKDLIERYNAGVRDRIVEIVARYGSAPVGTAPVYDVKAIRILPPIMYPMTMLNMAVNYREHGEEMERRDGQGAAVALGGTAIPGTAPPGTRSAPGIWDRKPDDKRWNPYLVVKLPAAVIAEGEAIKIPPGRTQIDWECELGLVIGRRADRVPAEKANEYVFGYTLENDVSDRGGRGDTRSGSDWLIAKSHDTFAPLGPFIIPREFVPDPQKLVVKYWLNGKLMQEANTSLMIHNVFEQIAYASNILTLRPGDVLATGTPAGVGSALKPPVYLKPGDLSVCSYEGIGTLTNPVVAK